MLRESGLILIYFLTLVLPLESAIAQNQSSDESPIYLQVNTIDKDKVTDVWEDKLHLEYRDDYGRTKDVSLKVFDWKRAKIAEIILGKDRGLNSYSIDLNEILPGREKKSTYTFLIQDEGGKTYKFLVRFVDAPIREEITAQILVNPQYLDCNDDISGNLIELYGSVGRGKAPYYVTWYVLNSSRTNLLYQPKAQTLEKQGTTGTITVDKSPDYYVVMAVVDDCGSEQYQLVHITCENDRKSVNTLFFESVKELIKLPPTQ